MTRSNHCWHPQSQSSIERGNLLKDVSKKNECTIGLGYATLHKKTKQSSALRKQKREKKGNFPKW